MNFWQEIKKKNGFILCLAPMADVTDAAFRYMIAKYSKKTQNTSSSLSMHKSLLAFCSARPVGLRKARSKEYFEFLFPSYVTYTEFVSADGLVLAPKEGKKKLLKNFEYSEIERPIVAQIFGSRPETIKKAAKLIVNLGFDGIDINMGCPDKNIEKQKAGAALIKNPKLAREIIAAAKAGVKEAAEKLNKKEIPVSVKTRIGFNKDELETWLPELLAENPAAITVHARTRKEMSKVPADWQRIKRAVEIRDLIQKFPEPQPKKCTDIFLLKNSSCPARSESQSESGGSARSASQGISRIMVSENKTLIIGNGDVKDLADAREKIKETGCDGVMLGRAVFGNPWLFSGKIPTIEERLKVMVEHAKLFNKKFIGSLKAVHFKNFAVMKKHFKSYVGNFEGSKKLKNALMEAENAADVEKIVRDFLI